MRSDTYDPKRSNNQTTASAPQIDKAMVDNKNKVAVRPANAPVEKIGFVISNGNGGYSVEKAADAKTTSEATRDTASASIPKDAVAVVHGHIDSKSDGIVSDRKAGGDFNALHQNLPNGVVSLGRVGVSEIVNGQLQFRMISGVMTENEIGREQQNLDRVQEDFHAAGGEK